MNDLHLPQLDLPPATAVQGTQSLRVAKRLAIAGILILLVGGTTRVLINAQQATALADYNAQSRERTVLIAKAKPGELQRTLSLPTTLRGNTEAVIYARTSGYLQNWHKGIGDQVKKGELLATIDAPEQTQELAQARAQREQIAARLELAEQTLARWETLQQRQSAISQQDLAEKRSSVRQSRADLAAADANVQRLVQLENFRRITAPFDGVITRRSVEVGDLISSNKELFAITQTDLLRLSVWVPQVYASDLKPGSQVNINLREQPGNKLKAIIDRMAGGIDAGTRSRQVELTLPNTNGKLLPGAYAEASLQLSSGLRTLVAPSAVLLITDQNQRVAVVDNESKIIFKQVKLGRDLGRDVEIIEGISPEDTLVVSPSDQLVEGEQVKTLAWQAGVSAAQSKPARP
jgi:membrane fusion protein, multidrug efflux system